ncbi:MAG: hypothetical protein BWY73_01441 [candidate division TA06 bacterium ADurb.Bin417]|uniref:Uncharacterized protein n=1 Tax=candidate division TA06 bacterium ADurb.Bin417 TaxID=1852828 RepID=A0A1V5M993_UNCT6|nr:MAG: hypothetical protein BWY73_01441 [candidate division TA06 bacterium ADurb.Bin417]
MGKRTLSDLADIGKNERFDQLPPLVVELLADRQKIGLHPEDQLPPDHRPVRPGHALDLPAVAVRIRPGLEQAVPVIGDETAGLHHVVIGEIAPVPGLHHHRGGNLDGPFHLGEVIPHQVAQAQPADTRLLARRGHPDQGLLVALGPEPDPQPALETGGDDLQVEFPLAALAAGLQFHASDDFGRGKSGLVGRRRGRSDQQEKQQSFYRQHSSHRCPVKESSGTSSEPAEIDGTQDSPPA